MADQDFKLVFEDGDLDTKVLDSLEDCANMVLKGNGSYDARELARDYNRAAPLYKLAMTEGRMSAYSRAIEALVAQGYPADSGMSPGGWADYKDVMDGLMDLDEMSFDSWIGYCKHWGDTWNEDYEGAVNDYFDWTFERLWPDGKVGPEINPEQASFIAKSHNLIIEGDAYCTDQLGSKGAEPLSPDRWFKLAPAYRSLKEAGHMIESPQLISMSGKYLEEYDQVVQKIKPPAVDKEVTTFDKEVTAFDNGGYGGYGLDLPDGLSLEEIEEAFRLPPSDEFEF